MRRLLGALTLAAAGRAGGQSPITLVPQPREVVDAPSLSLRGGVAIVRPAATRDRHAADDLAAALRERGVRVSTPGSAAALRVTLLRVEQAAARRLLAARRLSFDRQLHDEGYVLVADSGRATVVGATAAGVFYGVQTLKQLFEGRGTRARLRGARIRDWPAMRYRGLHDDLSRGPVPTLEFQKRQIRTLAAYKLNVYSPYFEHTLAYRSNPLIAPPGGAMTPEQVSELVAYAKRYHVDVIPEQQAFGHLHHVLKHELYSPLAETPHGHVLAPEHPGVPTLLRQMFAEIDSLFPSPFVHVGADETSELGRGRTGDRVRAEGMGAVYLRFLAQIGTLLRETTPASREKRALFWGDVAMDHPELVKALPRDMIAVAWDYDARISYDDQLRPFVDAGMETWIAPGVSNWSRVYPNYAVALPNIQRFARDGQRLGATGLLLATWDDDGESLFNQTWYGVLFGAAAAWQPGMSSTDDFQARYGRVFHGDTTGHIDEAQRKLAAAHALLRSAGAGDASDYLFWLDPWSPDGRIATQKLRPVVRDLRTLAEEAIVLLAQARTAPLRELDAVDAIELGARRMDLIGMKFQFADDVARSYGEAYDAYRDPRRSTSPTRYLGDISGINGRLQDLRDGYSLLRDEYERVWLAENRPYWLRNVLARYDLATQLWIGRADRVDQARQRWYRESALPAPAEVGIPEVEKVP